MAEGWSGNDPKFIFPLLASLPVKIGCRQTDAVYPLEKSLVSGGSRSPAR